MISLLNISLVISLHGCAAKKTSSVPTDTKPAIAADTAKSRQGVPEFAPSSKTEASEMVGIEARPIAIKHVDPVYPDSALRARIEGSVWVKVLVGNDGVVRAALIETPAKTKIGFEEAALTAAKATRWQPAVASGQPVALWVTYEIKFRL